MESTSIEGIIQALKHKASTFIVLNRFIPTTKECSRCHSKYDIKLDERAYECKYCGLIIDRYYNSALNDMHYGIKKINIPAERISEYKPVEMKTNTLEGLNISPYVRASILYETGSLNVLT